MQGILITLKSNKVTNIWSCMLVGKESQVDVYLEMLAKGASGHQET